MPRPGHSSSSRRLTLRLVQKKGTAHQTRNSHYDWTKERGQVTPTLASQRVCGLPEPHVHKKWTFTVSRTADFERHKVRACILVSDVREPSAVGVRGFGEAVLR
jgi:hypothetical protein